MGPRLRSAHAARLLLSALLLVSLGCEGGTMGSAPEDVGARADGGAPAARDAGTTPGTDAGPTPEADGGTTTAPASIEVTLVPSTGVSGTERVVFGLPLAPGQLHDADAVRVARDGVELAAARTALAMHPGGSVRSVQIQVEVDLDGETTLEVEVGVTPSAGTLDRASVESTLVTADGTEGPRVWAILPAEHLAASGVAGPMLPDSATDITAWDGVCDYAEHDTESFLSQRESRGVWLYDRGTVMYRGYARTGDLGVLESAYRETAIYRDEITGTGSSTRIGVPTADDDVKYHYAQNLAIHYLLTGDERFRESAEDVATRAHDLWSSPGYAGGADFWTERHAGFALLAYVWAAAVSDDRSAEIMGWADEAVDAYLDVQATHPAGYDDTDARCFAHHADAHGEGYGYFGCSPWMSAILADALDAYATQRGGDEAEAEAARQSIVKLGRLLARDGRDASGKPYYFVGVGTSSAEEDAYDEHWGESAYVVAMAWHHDGRSDDELRTAALSLIDGLETEGSAPHMRSMNWQCRSAVATPWFLE